MKGDDCFICGAPLFGKDGASYYEISHSYASRGPSGELDMAIPNDMHEYFCSEACLVEFVRERIEPDASPR